MKELLKQVVEQTNDIDSLKTAITDLISEYMEAKEYQEVTPEDIGLDVRAGYQLYLQKDEGIIVQRHSVRMLEYYGGFEYISPESKLELGDFVFYSSESSRVKDCIECYTGEYEFEEE